MNVILVANTIIGKSGNIGFRLGKIVDELSSRDVSFTLISRGCVLPNVECKSYYLHQVFARLLNALKIYIYRKLPAREIDLKIFEKLAAFEIKRILSNRNAHETVVHLLEPCPSIIELCHKYGVKVALDLPIAPSSYVEKLKREHGTSLVGNPGLVEREISSINRADLVISPSEFVNNEVKCISSNRNLSIVPFGVDWPRASQKKEVEENKIKFCFAGNLSKRKGVDYLLEAWEQFRDSSHELYLCGRIYPDIKKILDSKGFRNVFSLGFVDVSQVFRKCDVYVFPSLMEGSSKSIYEAMSYGLPVITTFESGSLIIDGDTGFIVPKMNKSDLACMMAKFIEKPSLIIEMGEHARRTIKKYSWSEYANNINLCYEAMIQVENTTSC